MFYVGMTFIIICFIAQCESVYRIYQRHHENNMTKDADAFLLLAPLDTLCLAILPVMNEITDKHRTGIVATVFIIIAANTALAWIARRRAFTPQEN